MQKMSKDQALVEISYVKETNNMTAKKILVTTKLHGITELICCFYEWLAYSYEKYWYKSSIQSGTLQI